MTEEKHRLEALSDWYLTEQLDFDKRLVGFRYETISPHLRGPAGLELGPADGQMTRLISPHFERLTVVDAAAGLLGQIPDMDNLEKVHSLFEEFTPAGRFDSIIMEHILEHVEKPVELLERVKAWLNHEGRLFLGVPNGNSIHRLAAVKMGLLDDPCQLNERDAQVGHRRVYTPGTFRRDIEAAGIHIEHMGGVYFKPLANGQIQDNWDEKMIRGFFELGKDFPDWAAEIYAVCTVP